MTTDLDIKRQVREFYNSVGWQEVSEGCYQNATFEDLRPVSREYVHKCHKRVSRHISPTGEYLLDAGSGPIQYPQYLKYSHGYNYRVCVDISSVALLEARKRIGNHGLFIVADIANLPFKAGCFDSVISLHTIHHLPQEEHLQAYQELNRVRESTATVVVVNGWDSPPIAIVTDKLVRWTERAYAILRGDRVSATSQTKGSPQTNRPPVSATPSKTHVQKHNASWLMTEVGSHMRVKIWTWRSVGVRFMRTFIHERWGGGYILRFLYWLEERFPHFFGKYGQYPLVVIGEE
jgi:ubiquinone/menaquinone biosynthesis C-methylase UbiE